MRWNDILSSALRNLFRRKLRSMLTMLGVVIGTCAIIVTLSLGYGAEKAQMEIMESSTNLKLIQVYPYYSYSDDTTSSFGRRVTRITDGVISRIRAIPGTSAVTPVLTFYPGATLRLLTGDYTAYAYVTAVIPADFYRIMDIETGSGFSNRTDRMEFMLNEVYMCEFKTPDHADEYIDVWTNLMDGIPLPTPRIRWLNADFDLTMTWKDRTDVDTVTGQQVQHVERYNAKCVGTFAADVNDWTFSNGPVVSLNWLRRFYRDNRTLMQELGVTDTAVFNYDNVLVLAETVDDVESLVRELNDIGLQCSSPMDYVNTFREQLATMQAFLGIIGAISMLVAALSIANTMMMSIYERTREIGVMKVLGCALGDIRSAFLCEAALIGVIGGLAGMAASFGLSWALNNVSWLQSAIASIMSGSALFAQEGAAVSVIPAPLALTTWLGVALVSILSGLYPAQRAMRLSALAAIRSED